MCHYGISFCSSFIFQIKNLKQEFREIFIVNSWPFKWFDLTKVFALIKNKMQHDSCNNVAICLSNNIGIKKPISFFVL